MDKDRLEGKAKDISGRVERKVGEWTGDKDAEAEGTEKQVEGKVQNAFGKVKDKLRDARDKVRDKAHDDDSEKDVA